MQITNLRPFKWGQGLGAGAPVVSAVSSTGASVAGTLATVGVLSGPAAPIVIAAAAVIALFSKFLGGGCGQACINASEAEQIYEAAADNLYAVAKAGMIPGSVAVQGMQLLIQAGEQHEAQLASSPGQATAAKNGSANLAKVIAAEMAAAQSLPNTVTQPLNLAAARALYIQPGKAGWYAASIAAAAQWTDTFLEQVAPALPAPAGSSSVASTPGSAAGILSAITTPLSEAGSALEQAAGSISPLLVIAGLGAGIWFLAS